MTDQERDLLCTAPVKGGDARGIIGAAIHHGEVLQAIEVAAEAVVVCAKAPIAAAAVDEDHRKGGVFLLPDAGDVDETTAEL